MGYGFCLPDLTSLGWITQVRKPLSGPASSSGCSSQHQSNCLRVSSGDGPAPRHPHGHPGSPRTNPVVSQGVTDVRFDRLSFNGLSGGVLCSVQCFHSQTRHPAPQAMKNICLTHQIHVVISVLPSLPYRETLMGTRKSGRGQL